MFEFNVECVSVPIYMKEEVLVQNIHSSTEHLIFDGRSQEYKVEPSKIIDILTLRSQARS